MTQPRPASSPPTRMAMRGPNLSCSRPAGIMVMAKNAHIVEYGSAMSALLQPHDAGMPARTTLQM